MKRFQPHDPDEEAEVLVAEEDIKTEKGRLLSKRQFNWFHPAIIIVAAIIVLSGLLLLTSHLRSREDDFTKPVTDLRQYETFSLSNGLQVLAISDPTATTSAAALSLKVGSFADPLVMPGLAHFMEHLVFLGSYTYPELDGYTKFVKNRGGANNAFTANEETNFFFKVPTSSFDIAIDMFLHMFVDPIFTREWAGNEVASVDAEYKMDLQNDAWKYEFALKLASNPRNPLSRFSIGSTGSLITDPESNNVIIVNQLENFFDTFYSSNLMNLVVLHNQSISDLRDGLEPQFSEITQKRSQKPTYDSLPKPFSGDYANKLVQFLTSGSDTTAHIVFCVDSSLPYTEIDPLNYLYTLLNYESPGSLISVLKDNGWVLEVQCQSAVRVSSFELVDITMTLTQEGRKNIAEITKVVLAYLDLIRRKGLAQELFDQFSFITKYIFEYSQYKDEQEDVLEEIRNIASNTGVYPPKYVLAGNKVLFNFDSDYMDQFLRELNPDNLMIFVSAPDFVIDNPAEDVLLQELSTAISADTKQEDANADTETEDDEPAVVLNRLNRHDEIYDLDYTITSLTPEFLDSIRDISYQIYPELNLPGPNGYVPEAFDIMGSDCSGSKCIEIFDSDRFNQVKNLAESPRKVWYLLERSFGVPLTTCYIRLNTAKLETSNKYLAASGIFGQLNSLLLSSELYQIEYAGNDVTYKPKYMKVEAFTDTFPEVLETVLDQYSQNEATETQFQDAKANFISSLYQDLTEKPYSIAPSIKDNFLLGRNVTVVDVIAQAESMTFADFQATMRDLKSSSQTEIFLYGNILEDLAEEFADDITQELNPTTSQGSQPYQGTVVNLQGKNFVYRDRTSVLKDGLTLTLNYYQGKPVSIKDITALKLVTKILDPEAFSYLRTEKKLGYVVALRDDLVGNVTGMKVLVLSTDFDTNQVDLEIENFWQKAKDVLDKLTDDDVTNIAISYGEGLNYNSKSFRIKGEHVYNHILNNDYLFGLEDSIKAYLPKITKDDLLTCFDSLVKQATKLSIQLYSEENENVPTSVVPASQQYSNTTPVMITSINDLSSLPRYTRDVSIQSTL